MTVRTDQLDFRRLTGTGWQTLYTVPSGRRTILKSILVWNQGGGGTVNVLANTGGAANAMLHTQGISPSARGYVELWVVLEAGQYIEGQSTVTNTWCVCLSGTELVLT